jgi:purine-nucleoside phosphorylase
VPTVAVVAGTGLSGVADVVAPYAIVPYGDIPGWPVPTVQGHMGSLVLGHVDGVAVAVLLGRAHLYEGQSPRQATFGVRLLRALGTRDLVLTNAAGALDHNYRVGDLVVIADQICLPGLFGANPLVGPNDDAVGPRFPTMTDVYDPDLRRIAREVGRAAGFTVHDGIYAMVVGPSYETPAEARCLRAMGADVVGMSTAIEAVAARHAGMRVLGLSVVTNVVRTAPSGEHAPPPHDLHAEVVAACEAASARLARTIATAVPRIALS